LKKLYAQCRQAGRVILRHRFHVNLSPKQSSLYESAKLAAIGKLFQSKIMLTLLGPFNMCNVINGEKIYERLGWTREELVILGSYLIWLEFQQYSKLKDENKFEKVDLETGKIFGRW
jgi:hypothetical protein